MVVNFKGGQQLVYSCSWIQSTDLLIMYNHVPPEYTSYTSVVCLQANLSTIYQLCV